MTEKMFHVSENPSIAVFVPRPSPSVIPGLEGEVVFAITEDLLHNYLLPRDCPRVTFYCNGQTTEEDKERFFGGTTAGHVVAIETRWFERVENTVLYCYVFAGEDFEILDECAGYYISRRTVEPVEVRKIERIFDELLKRNIELRVMPSLWKLADQVKDSSLGFSIIRMRNAQPR